MSIHVNNLEWAAVGEGIRQHTYSSANLAQALGRPELEDVHCTFQITEIDLKPKLPPIFPLASLI